MGYDTVLTVLNSFKKGDNNDKIIEETVNKAISLLSVADKESIENLWSNLCYDKNNIRWKYVLFTIFIIKSLKNLNNDTFTVKDIQTLKTSMEIIILLGIKPNCDLYQKSLNCKEISTLKKYEKLIYVTEFFIGCFDDFLLKTCAMPHIGPILNSSMFIAYSVIIPSNTEQNLTKNDNVENMDTELYSKLQSSQKEFKIKLQQIMEKLPATLIMKEFMVICGTSKYPKFMRVFAQKYLVDYIIKPNGVLYLVSTMCNEEESINLTNHWNRVEVAAKLLAVPQGNNTEKYYNSICNQIIDLLTTEIRKNVSIAKCCIKALYEYNADICMEKFFKRIAAPFFHIEDETKKKTLWTEQEVTKSIEILSKCFDPNESEFKQLPTEMLIPIALPMFCLYNKSLHSISSLRCKIRQLTLKIFSLENIRVELFSLFLDYNMKFSYNYGIKLNFQLGDSSDFQIVESCEEIDRDKVASALFELVNQDKIISFELFKFLLTTVSLEQSCNTLETNCNIMNQITQQLTLINLLVQLANLSVVQKSNLEKPESLLNFVKSLIQKQNASESKSLEDEEGDLSYIGLMLIKEILSESEKCTNWAAFEQFILFLSLKETSKSIPSCSKKMVEEIIHLVKTKGKSQKKYYDDLAVKQDRSDFEKALEDLADPLLPVRAHGLISMTRLIEKGDSETLGKKDILICIFQENLKHEDSFIYLASINGLCAMTVKFPQNVIEILIQEFINMPQRVSQYELSAENRVKLGEILVKATRSLGEMASAHKTPLINGFLCAVRDSDTLVRASSLSCLGELCKVLGFRLGHITEEVIYCIGCIIKSEKEPECRRAAVLVITLLFQGLGKDILTSLSNHLVEIYKSLKYLRDNDNDEVIRLHAQLALEEIDDIVKNQLFVKPKLQKNIFLLPSS